MVSRYPRERSQHGAFTIADDITTAIRNCSFTWHSNQEERLISTESCVKLKKEAHSAKFYIEIIQLKRIH